MKPSQKSGTEPARPTRQNTQTTGDFCEIIALGKRVVLHGRKVILELQLGLNISFHAKNLQSTFRQLSKLTGKKIALMLYETGSQSVCVIRPLEWVGRPIQGTDAEANWLSYDRM